MDYSVRSFKPGDFEDIYEIRCLESTAVTLGDMPNQSFSDMCAQFSAGGIGRFQHILVAEAESELGERKVIGVAALSRSSVPRLRHSGSIWGVAVHEDYRAHGIGTALVRALVDFSDKWLMLRRLELFVRANNDKAIDLYEKIGFKKEGLCKDVVLARGGYEDAWVMARIKKF